MIKKGRGTRDEGRGREISNHISKQLYNLTNKNPVPCPLSPVPCLLLICLLLLGCSQKKLSKSEFVLGTYCTVTLFEQGHEQVLQDVFARLREIDNLFSMNVPSSDISRINAGAGIEPVQVSFEVFQLIIQSLNFAQLSDCAFNPAIGPIVNLWNISGNPRVPSQQEIDEILPLTYLTEDAFDLDHQTNSVFLKRRGMALDLGAIAKGYAADEIAKIIIDTGIKRAIIDLGGNIVIIGQNENNRPWRVGIQDPNGERGEYIEVVEVEIQRTENKMSIVTSGVYERYFESDGYRYHHIFSPVTGYPVDNELLSVTIITESAMMADALSTAVFVLGHEKGQALIDNILDTEAVFIFKNTN